MVKVNLDPMFANIVGEHEYYIEWYCGGRKLSIYTSPTEIYGFKVDYNNQCGQVEDVDGDLDSLHAAWDWLTEKECL